MKELNEKELLEVTGGDSLGDSVGYIPCEGYKKEKNCKKDENKCAWDATTSTCRDKV